MCPGLTSPGAKLYPAAAETVCVSFQPFGSCTCFYVCVLLRMLLISLVLLCSERGAGGVCHGNIARTNFSLTHLTSQAIMAEGKQYALCVGVMKMSADDM